MNLNLSTIKYAQKLPFCANDREVLDSDNKVVHRNSTKFFRDDIIWDDFTLFLDENFKDSKKVNSYCIACSDGSEPYSLAIALKTNLKNADKFFPINASDYDEYIVNEAKNGVYTTTYDEKNAIRRFTRDNKHKYFDCDGPDIIKPKDSIKKEVNFTVNDALSEIDNIPYGDNLIMCRNFWPYLSSDDKNKLIEKLKEKMNHNSLLVIGSFDQGGIMLDRLLDVSGFENVEYTRNDRGSEMVHYNVWKKHS